MLKRKWRLDGRLPWSEGLMVSTSAASPAASAPWLAEPHAHLAHQAHEAQQAHETLNGSEPGPVACTILTPSGALLARAMVRPRPATLPEDSYALELSQVEPRGALEPLLRSNPQVVLRMPHEAQLALRIDHIIGPREQRTYYLQSLAVEAG